MVDKATMVSIYASAAAPSPLSTKMRILRSPVLVDSVQVS